MKVGIAGMSHLGLVTGVAFASRGIDVIGYDADDRLALPLHEPGLEEKRTAAAARLRFSSDPAALAVCDVVYVALDVKTSDRDESDLTELDALIERVLPHLAPNATLVVHSQVPPGYTRRVAARARGAGMVAVFYQVETLIFGRALERALEPERYIVGAAEPAEPFPAPYARLLEGFGCPILRMRYESAELAKISINLFLISTVTTTNMLAEVCERIGADWEEIAPALRLDRRIGQHAYLAPGLGISGGNLHRDLVTILALGQERGAEVGQAAIFRRDSDYRRDWVLRLVSREVLSANPGARLALWGLAYKPNTQSIKNSPSLRLIRQLEKASISAYDPVVRVPDGFPRVRQAESAAAACQGADALVIMTPWDEFRRAEASVPVVIDPFGVLAGRVQERTRYFRLGVHS